MRHIDHGGAKILVKPGDLKTHLHPQFGIKVRQRLVKEEYFRLANDRPANGHTLALASRKRLRLAFQKIMKTKDIGGAADACVNFVPRHTIHLQAEGHVVIDIHMRVQRVGLEYHRHATIGRIGQADIHPADFHRAVGHRFKAGDHPQQSGFSASGWPDKDSELTIGDIEVDTMDHPGVAKGLVNVFQTESRQEYIPVHAPTSRCATG